VRRVSLQLDTAYSSCSAPLRNSVASPLRFSSCTICCSCCVIPFGLPDMIPVEFSGSVLRCTIDRIILEQVLEREQSRNIGSELLK